MKRMDAAKVANVGYTALKKRRVTVVTGPMYSFIVFLFRFLPRKFATRFTRSLG